MAKFTHEVTYKSTISFDETHVPLLLRSPEHYEKIAEAAFFQSQVGEWKVEEVTLTDPATGVEFDFVFERPIPFDVDDTDLSAERVEELQ
jgi:hypothetical protein